MGPGVRRDDTDWRYSSRANFSKEFGDLTAQLKTLRLQRLGGLPYVLSRRSSGIRVGFDPRDIFRDVPGAPRGVLGAAGDFLGSGALLLDRRRDRGRDIIDLADDAANSLDGVDGVTGHLLDVGDLLGNIVARFRALARPGLSPGAAPPTPPPASPARAPPMVAFSANRFVCAGIELIRPAPSPIRPAVFASP